MTNEEYWHSDNVQHIVFKPTHVNNPKLSFFIGIVMVPGVCIVDWIYCTVWNMFFIARWRITTLFTWLIQKCLFGKFWFFAIVDNVFGLLVLWACREAALTECGARVCTVFTDVIVNTHLNIIEAFRWTSRSRGFRVVFVFVLFRFIHRTAWFCARFT